MFIMYWGDPMQTLSHSNRSYQFTPFGPLLRDVAPTARFRRVLDLGCGDGANTQRLFQVADEVWGVDSNVDLIQSARSAFPEVRFNAQRADEFLAHSQITYDGIFCSRLLGFIPDLGALFEPLRRCATGQLLISDWHPLACWVTPDGIVGKDYSSEGCFAPGQYHHSVATVTNSLIASGFSVQSIIEGPSRRVDPYYSNSPAEVRGLPLAVCWICTVELGNWGGRRR